MKYFLVFCGCLILFASCSIEKRHYLTGYSMHWLKNNKADKQNIYQTTIISPDKPPLLIYSQPEEKQAVSEPLEASAEKLISPDAETAKANFVKKKIREGPLKNGLTNTVEVRRDTVVQNSEKAKPSDDAPVHWAAVTSLIMGILGVLLQPQWAITAIVFGFIAKSELKKKPGKYSGDKYAKWGLILGFIGVAEFVLFFAAYIALIILLSTQGYQ